MSSRMPRIRRVLVALGHLKRPSRALLRKAAAIARATGSSIELFHADIPDSSGTVTVASAARKLQRLASSPFFKGLKVSSHLERDYPPHEAIVRRALATGVSLVIASLRVPALPARLWLRNTDWELIRACPCPVLLVKSNRAYRNPAILAAVDPFHAHAKPAALDQKLLATGGALARALRGTLHAFHCYLPLLNTLPTPMGPVVPIGFPQEMEDVHGQQVEVAFDRLAQGARIPPARRHLHMGNVTDELNATVNDVHAGIVVMGAVSRSALKRAFIGNTAETVLNAIPCDVLIVKPRLFRTSVPRRRGKRG
jgi:universal stress protein E